jgi:phosphonate transport system ATP-binding protein
MTPQKDTDLIASNLAIRTYLPSLSMGEGEGGDDGRVSGPILALLHQGGRNAKAETRMSVSPTITLDHVGKRFQAKRALEQVSATIHAGEVVAVIGKSGAGKTTLLRCLACSTPVTEGVIRFGAQDLATLQGAGLRLHRARVGMIYQQFNLVKRLRVLDNVLIGRLPHLTRWQRWAALGRYFAASQQEIALRCLDHVGLLDRVWQRTDTLSGGEQQRVAIAKILAQEPQVILADEPVASLDVMNGGLVMETLQHIASTAGLTVIASLHHVEYARRYAHRILGLRGGRLVFDGPPAELTEAALVDIFGEVASEGPGSGPMAIREAIWAIS